MLRKLVGGHLHALAVLADELTRLARPAVLGLATLGQQAGGGHLKLDGALEEKRSPLLDGRAPVLDLSVPVFRNPQAGRGLRPGACSFLNSARNLRSAVRGTVRPESRFREFGFRCVRGQTASLNISFQSEVRGLTDLRVDVNGKTVLSQIFDNRLASPDKTLRADRTVEIEAGNAEIQVWVERSKEEAKLITRTGNFPGGSSRSLDIRLSGNGQPSVNLN